MPLTELETKINERQATIGVIGLGYVGLPLACIFADLGYRVIGLDIKRDRVQMINTGQSPIGGREPGLSELLARVIEAGQLHATDDYRELAVADIITINVETPVDENHCPRYQALRAACYSLGPVMKEGALVIVESTVAPGTVDELVRPLLESTSGKTVNTGFYLGACPERVMPGRLLANLRGLSRVCGGANQDVAEAMLRLYGQFVQAELDATDIITAELVKTTENAYRDVQIAFANEVALICERVGADVWRVRELVNKSPYREMHAPGSGVGGHCIPKDPWLLTHSAKERGMDLRLIPAARAVNDSMPLHTASLLADALHEASRRVCEARILILGYSYLEDTDDIRNSPSEVLAHYLRESGAEVVVHDPYVLGHQGDVQAVARGTDAVVGMVKHRAYLGIELDLLKSVMRTPILIDGRQIFDLSSAQACGFICRGVGKNVATQNHPRGTLEKKAVD